MKYVCYLFMVMSIAIAAQEVSEDMYQGINTSEITTIFCDFTTELETHIYKAREIAWIPGEDAEFVRTVGEVTCYKETVNE